MPTVPHFVGDLTTPITVKTEMYKNKKVAMNSAIPALLLTRRDNRNNYMNCYNYKQKKKDKLNLTQLNDPERMNGRKKVAVVLFSTWSEMISHSLPFCFLLPAASITLSLSSPQLHTKMLPPITLLKPPPAPIVPLLPSLNVATISPDVAIADVWATSSSAELCRCGPQTADVLTLKKQTEPKCLTLTFSRDSIPPKLQGRLFLAAITARSTIIESDDNKTGKSNVWGFTSSGENKGEAEPFSEITLAFKTEMFIKTKLMARKATHG
ncbi:hypothetical protein LXL04_026438 [Taraxacum kok-saghyz]